MAQPAPETPTPAAPAEPRVQPAPGSVSESAKAIVEAKDRTEDDRKRDARRHPGELLTFVGVGTGWKVADLGAGDGYSTELLARAVGTNGVVFAQNNQYSLERFVKEKWPARLGRAVNAKVVRVDREYDDVLPPEAKDLDLVTILFSYHDVIAQGHDTSKLNAAVFRALKPEGHYVVADHSAQKGSGLEAAKAMHRLEESIVKEQVAAAGFVLKEEAQFYRDLSDDLSKVSYEIGFKTDRYLLKFEKPAATK